MRVSVLVPINYRVNTSFFAVVYTHVQVYFTKMLSVSLHRIPLPSVVCVSVVLSLTYTNQSSSLDVPITSAILSILGKQERRQ